MNIMNDWLCSLRSYIKINNPELLKIFEIYAAEAIFGRKVLETNLAQLPENSRIVEIGAGALILSTQLMREGFDVTAIEPVESGFSHFNELQNLVIARAIQEDCLPKIITIHGEHLTLAEQQDFAFSINVMEHVEDPEAVIHRVSSSLKPNAVYRFVCPNYTFPYEPHFNIPTIISKKITERLFNKQIFDSKHVMDPKGTWDSLNWINVHKLKCSFRASDLVSLKFDKTLLATMFERAVTDVMFLARRPIWLSGLFKAIVRLNIHQLFQYIPASIQPVIDCTVQLKRKG